MDSTVLNIVQIFVSTPNLLLANMNQNDDAGKYRESGTNHRCPPQYVESEWGEKHNGSGGVDKSCKYAENA